LYSWRPSYADWSANRREQRAKRPLRPFSKDLLTLEPTAPAIVILSQTNREMEMLYYALVFLVVALIAGVLGFGGIAGASASIAQVLFFLFLVLFVVSVVMRLLRRA
jgi:uncharacterized membrane protein YtjA (UPF0391 family)